MKIYIANYQANKIGGGWSFIRNFVKGMGDTITQNYDQADIYFIASPSMVQREDVQKAKRDKKRIVLRIDNIVRNSRNRNTGMSRMKDFAEWADLVIYQSVAAQKLLQGFTSKKGQVILNSTDEDVFHRGKLPPDSFTFLYSRQNRDETKNFEVARAYFASISEIYNGRLSLKPRLTLVGQYSQELREGNFDFYNNEKFTYLGSITDPESMANIYRNNECLIYTYWQDACSNTLIEALMCGCKIDFPDEYYRKGSANEIMVLFDLYGREYFSLKRMADEYTKAIGAII